MSIASRATDFDGLRFEGHLQGRRNGHIRSMPANGSRTRPMEAVVLAGGKGLRLHPYTTVIPKPLVPIGEKHSVLEVIACQLAAQGFGRVTLALGHLADLVQAYVGDGSRWGLELHCVREDLPLGTAGPVINALSVLPDHFVVLNADVLTDLDYSDLLRRHIDSHAALTVATQLRDHHVDFGVLDIRDSTIRGFSEKPTLKYCVNMGIYAVSKEALLDYQPGTPLGFDDLIVDMLTRGDYPATYEFGGFWLDIGRPDDYDRANREFSCLYSHMLKAGK